MKQVTAYSEKELLSIERGCTDYFSKDKTGNEPEYACYLRDLKFLQTIAELKKSCARGAIG